MLHGLNRIKIDYDPETKKHVIYGWGNYFYLNDPNLYEDWESLGSIEGREDWKELLMNLIEYYLEEDKK
jgi:hypothetical protein